MDMNHARHRVARLLVSLSTMLSLWLLAPAAAWSQAGARLVGPEHWTSSLQDLQRGQAQLVVVFMLDRCPHCERLHKEQLTPLASATDLPRPVTIMTVNLRGTRKLAIPGRGEMTEAEWAKALGIRMAPTTLVLDRQGNPVDTPIIGYTSRDFYLGFLQQRLERAATTS